MTPWRHNQHHLDCGDTTGQPGFFNKQTAEKEKQTKKGEGEKPCRLKKMGNISTLDFTWILIQIIIKKTQKPERDDWGNLNTA